jgi:PAS domain S-box-containing protein
VNPRQEKNHDLAERLKRAEEALRARELNFERAQAQLAGEKRLLEMVASGHALPDVLTELCKFVETTAGDCKCGIYLIDWDTGTFRLGAAPSLPATFNEPVEGLTVSSEAGPCGVAALDKDQILVTDINSDPRFQAATIRSLLLAHGLRSHWSTPIFSRHGEVLGTFAIFQNHPASPTELHQELIGQVTYIASIAMERASSEEALRRSERNLSLTINTIPTFIQVSRSDGSVLSVNQAVLDYYGVTLEDMQKEDFRSRVYHPDDAEKLRALRNEALKRPLQFEYEQRALGKDGKYRWFLVRYNPLLDEHGGIERWYATAFDIEDRKRAEYEREQSQKALTRALAEIQKSESKLRQVIDAIPAMAWSAHPDGSGEFFNQHYLDYVGLTAEYVAGWGWIGAVHPDDVDGLSLIWQQIRESGQFGEGEVRLRRHDGEYRWFLFRVNPVRDESGRVSKWYGTNIDITERKLALESLQANQDLLDLAQKSARAMAFDWYINKEINYWSPEQEALYGLAPGTFDGTFQSWKSMIYAEDWPNVVEAVRHAQQTGEVATEFRVVWPDGSLHWLSTIGRMFFGERGEPVRIVGFTSDISRRKLIEEELRRSEEFLAQAQQLSRTGSFSWRVATDEITWSDELYRIYELEPGIPITLDVIRSRVHPEDISLYESMKGSVRREVDDFEWQYRLLMPDGSIKYMQAVAHATRDQNGQLEYIAAVRDVTARRLSDEALDKARSELAHVARAMSLGALTASIAHEVNQPLSGIITNASTCVRMLDGDPPNVDGARETAKRTIRDGRRAADVITRLRALFSKKEAGTELVDLNEATREVIALSLSELDRNRVITRTELADQLPLVTGDRVQLQQVIINLLRNGSDAMSDVDDRPRELLFTTEVDEGNVRLSVRDAGTGFDQQTADQLFRSFYTTKADGMGIGLSVSRSIIENHQGRLWATQNDGPGVTFSFSIPCAANGL